MGGHFVPSYHHFATVRCNNACGPTNVVSHTEYRKRIGVRGFDSVLCCAVLCVLLRHGSLVRRGKAWPSSFAGTRPQIWSPTCRVRTVERAKEML